MGDAKHPETMPCTVAFMSFEYGRCHRNKINSVCKVGSNDIAVALQNLEGNFRLLRSVVKLSQCISVLLSYGPKMGDTKSGVDSDVVMRLMIGYFVF